MWSTTDVVDNCGWDRLERGAVVSVITTPGFTVVNKVDSGIFIVAIVGDIVGDIVVTWIESSVQLSYALLNSDIDDSQL